MTTLDITAHNAQLFGVYTTYFVKVSGDAIGGDVFALGIYRVHVQANQILEDSAGAAIDLVRSNLHIMYPDNLFFRVYDVNGTELRVFCENSLAGVYGHMVRVDDTPPPFLQHQTQESRLDAIFAAMR